MSEATATATTGGASGARSHGDPAEGIRKAWRRLGGLPGGKTIFSKMLGFMVPYTGTVGARVIELEPGYARVELRDRRRVRNHLRSIHAIALANLGEMATGLALNYGMPSGSRGILTAIRMEYLKKARGTLMADCRCDIGDVSSDRDLEIVGEIKDASGDVVARAIATWRIGPVRRRTGAAAGSTNT
jgi:acyl-coenzyme A thioesterase PaaI-like protein